MNNLGEYIHQFRQQDECVVMDINSGTIHVVDPLVYDIIEVHDSGGGYEDIKRMLKDKHKDVPLSEVSEAYSEILELIDEEMLFTDDPYKDRVLDFKNQKTVVKALCLHIAHDCNLSCKYCFAEEGMYHGKKAELMSPEVGKKALDFLVENSGDRRNLEVDFFGGEPLLNFETVKEIVRYGRNIEKKNKKKFRFTLTTNGVLVNDEVIEFANKEMDNVVLSIDGRKEVHDKMRPFRKKGVSSYELILPKIKKFADSRNQDKYYVRGTFTRENLDFSKDVIHLADLGFKQISVEPVVAKETDAYALKKEDLPELFKEYEDLALALTSRADPRIIVKLMKTIKGSDDFIARTNGTTIQMHPFASEFEGLSRHERYGVLYGVVTHEIAHVLYTDFRKHILDRKSVV